jgi:hypothetical protein
VVLAIQQHNSAGAGIAKKRPDALRCELHPLTVARLRKNVAS